MNRIILLLLLSPVFAQAQHMDDCWHLEVYSQDTHHIPTSGNGQ